MSNENQIPPQDFQQDYYQGWPQEQQFYPQNSAPIGYENLENNWENGQFYGENSNQNPQYNYQQNYQNQQNFNPNYQNPPDPYYQDPYYQQQYQQGVNQYQNQYYPPPQQEPPKKDIKEYLPYIIIIILLLVSLIGGGIYYIHQKQVQADEEARILEEMENKVKNGEVYDENGNLLVEESDGSSPSSRPIDPNTNLTGSIVDKFNSIEEKDKNVVGLSESFFTNWNPDMMKIKETHYRNLNINPEFESDKKFFVYNSQGILKPYNPEVYYNREILGLSITQDYLINSVKYDYELNLDRPSREEPPIKLGITFDKTDLRNKIKTNLDILRSSGFYPDLVIFTDDEIIQKIFNTIEPYNLSREDALKYYVPEYLEQPDAYFARNAQLDEMDKEMYLFKYKKIPQVTKLIRVSPAKTLTKVQYGQTLFDCIKKRTELELDSIKKEACSELENYKGGTCKNYKDISTLEIRSDFMQDIYVKAFTKAVEDFYFIIYYAYDGLSNT